MITYIIVILNILAWPVALVIVAFLWKRHLLVLLQRTTKVSFYGLELELASEIGRSTKWSTETGDARKATPAPEYNSGLKNLLEQFREKGSYDYAVIDLGRGESWLTSRLFIFSLMLHRMCGLRCWVFVEPGAGINQRFLGFARPTEVRWALARRYPYLEAIPVNE